MGTDLASKNERHAPSFRRQPLWSLSVASVYATVHQKPHARAPHALPAGMADALAPWKTCPSTLPKPAAPALN